VAERDASLAAPGVHGEAAVALGEIPLTLAWNVRGDGAEPPFVEAANRLLGVAPPGQPNTSARTDDAALLWMGPTSWMFVAGPDAARPAFDDIRRALNDAGGALFDVSSSYIAWKVAGPAAARVLNRGCPLDLHPDAFPAGDVGLLRALGLRASCELEKRAEAWRPWRSYASMYLWSTSKE
jgi:sarcosine oxidase subunit gamma